MTPFIVILTGPTCAGKSTLEAKLREVGFVSAISTTTRAPRAGEVDGENYHFVTPMRFLEMKEEGSLVESVEFGGNHYGLTRAEVERIAAYGAPLVVVVEPQGRNQIIEFCERRCWAYHTVYVGNSDQVISQRFLRRLNGELAKFQGEDEDHEAQGKVIERYAARMEQMLTTERAWMLEAYFQSAMGVENRPYDRLLWEFGPENDKQVIASIVEEFRKHRLCMAA